MAVFLVSIPDEFLTESRRKALEQYSGDRELLITRDPKVIEGVIERVEVILGSIPHEWVGKATSLKWYQQFGTGTEWLWQYPAVMDRPFVLTNCSDDYGVVLAEHVLSLMLACARQLPKHFEAQQRQSWESGEVSDSSQFELRGKTLLLIGVGSIGKAIARRARGFEMIITGLRSNPNVPVEGIDVLYGRSQLLEAIAEADIVVNSLPYTKNTSRMIDADAIAAMKPSAYFFNIGRGTTVDEKALTRAIMEKRIAGAGLDVFETEPLPKDSPLWQLPNVIITPHDGGNHGQRMESWVRTVFDNLQRFAENRDLRNVVNKRRSY